MCLNGISEFQDRCLSILPWRLRPCLEGRFRCSYSIVNILLCCDWHFGVGLPSGWIDAVPGRLSCGRPSIDGVVETAEQVKLLEWVDRAHTGRCQTNTSTNLIRACYEVKLKTFGLLMVSRLIFEGQACIMLVYICDDLSYSRGRPELLSSGQAKTQYRGPQTRSPL